MIYSLLESARANGHNPFHYLSVLLTELPNVSSPEQIQALLPWNLTAEQSTLRHHEFPKP